MRKHLIRLEHWIFHDESVFVGVGKLFLVILVAISPLIGYAIYAGHRAERACAAAGGAYTAVGTRTVYLWNAATKTTLPHTVTEYACLMPRP